MAELSAMVLPATISVLVAVLVNPPPPDAVFPLNRLPFTISAVPPSLKRPPPPDAELPETTVSSIFSVPPFQIPPPPPPPPPPVTAPPSNITDTVVFEESVLDGICDIGWRCCHRWWRRRRRRRERV